MICHFILKLIGKCIKGVLKFIYVDYEENQIQNVLQNQL